MTESRLAFLATLAAAYQAQDQQVTTFFWTQTARSTSNYGRPQLIPLVRPGGLLVVDNAVLREAELRPFSTLVATPGVTTVTVPIGKGEMLIWKTLATRQDNWTDDSAPPLASTKL